MEAGADGVMFMTSIRTGDGDFIHALSAAKSIGIFSLKAVREAATAMVNPELILITYRSIVGKKARYDSLFVSA